MKTKLVVILVAVVTGVAALALSMVARADQVFETNTGNYSAPQVEASVDGGEVNLAFSWTPPENLSVDHAGGYNLFIEGGDGYFEFVESLDVAEAKFTHAPGRGTFSYAVTRYLEFDNSPTIHTIKSEVATVAVGSAAVSVDAAPPTEFAGAATAAGSMSGAAGPIAAVPGAVGGGKDSVGGRGGRVLIVNTTQNLVNPNDDFLSLREAVMVETGPRIITFSVGGVFDVGFRFEIMNKRNFTVACQTAPAPGVIIKTSITLFSGGSDNIVMQHCVHRNTDGSDYGRGLGFGDGAHDIYIDHASVSWASDENAQIYQSKTSSEKLHRISLADSIFAEGDADSSHPQSLAQRNTGYHAMGPACNSNNPQIQPDEISITRNFLAHNAQRMGSQYSCTGETTNNIIYNWTNQGTDLLNWGGDLHARVRNNLYKSGPSTKTGRNFSNDVHCGQDQFNCAINIKRSQPNSALSLEVADNYFLPADGSIGDAVSMGDHPSPHFSPSVVQEFPWAAPTDEPITAMAAPGSSFLECVGASRPIRDSIDARVIQEFHDGTGKVGIFDNQIGSPRNSTVQRDYSMYSEASHPADHDTDADGMPDSWELANGFAVGQNDSSGDLDNDGWTNIEEYLADAAAC